MAENALAGHRVLVVEDEYFLADEIDRGLRKAGAVVLGPVPSVEDALDLLKADKPDAAVLDVNLGGEMAFAVADALVSRGVPFVFTTGYDQTALPERFASARRLLKPVEVAVTLREVGELLRSEV